MPDNTSKHGLGVALVAAAAVAWSTAPFFVRLLPLDSFTILFWRGVFAGSATVALLVLVQGRSSLTDLTRMHRGGLLFAVFSAVAMLLFIPSLQLTSVANVAIIMAIVPFAAAALAWVWFRETPRRRTVLASAIAVLGVAISVGGASAGADMKGILLALLMMLSIAGMTVTARRYRDTPLVAAAALSNFLGAAASLPFAQGVASVSAHDIVILAAFGVLQVALGLTFFVLGSRHLPAAQAALIATLETPLMPFWVWLAFNDAPGRGQLLGGAIVLAAVVADILGDLRSQASLNRRTDEALAESPSIRRR
jgi:drug/metabolite transporter (DMT)-like permease